MAEQIQHPGVVESIDNESVSVRIQRQSACAACHAKGACSAADKEDRLITILTNQPLYIGQEVFVTGSYKMGLQAVFLSFVLPFLLLLISLAILSQWLNEGWSGLCSLGSLLIYYGILFLFRKRIKKNFSFHIEIPNT